MSRRSEQFQLTDLNRKTRVLNFQQISPVVQSTIRRLVSGGGLQGGGEERKARYCWFYIDPMSGFALAWSLLFMVVFYLLELQISLSLAFGPKFLDEELALHSVHRAFYLLAVFFLLVDMLLSFFWGYYSAGRGRVVDDWGQIVRKYLWGQFWLDLVVWVVYVVPLVRIGFALNFLQLVPAGLLWVKKFSYQGRVIAQLQYSPGARVVFMLVVLFSDVLMVGNYGACVFIGMDVLLYDASYYGDNSAYYWLTNNTSYPLSLIAGPWYYQYIYGQEFATGTLSTLAPGPFAKNPIEAMYAIVVMILFMVLASYVGEVLIQIIYTHAERRIFHEENIMAFDNFMQLKQVERAIRSRIYNFFELIWEVELKVESKQQEQLIDNLPLYLKQELLLEMGFSRSIYFLHRLPNHHALQNLISMRLQRATLDAGTCIFATDRPEPPALFFVKEGMAKFYVRAGEGERVVNLTNVQRVLGVYEFVSGQEFGVCCKSIDLCLIQKLTFATFRDIVTQLAIHEEFKELQHRVLLDRDMTLINKICVLCLEPHAEADCPDLHASQRIAKGLLDSNYLGRECQRKSYKRRDFGRKRVIGGGYRRAENASIFNLFQGINLGKMILEINRLDNLEDPIDQVSIFRAYFTAHNIA